MISRYLDIVMGPVAVAIAGVTVFEARHGNNGTMTASATLVSSIK
jgi:hypothetical protein